jgi:hypothetical protein
MSIFWNDDTDSTEKWDSEYVSDHDSAVDMHMEDDVDATDSINPHGDLEMERDGEHDEREDGELEDVEKEDEVEVEEEEED